MDRRKAKGRKDRGTFLALPHAVLDSENFRQLSAPSVRMLVDLGRQYNGSNNGDFCAAWSVLKARGWKSRDTLTMALRELEHYGFILKTRQGGKHRPNLYAVTWLNIDECKGKLEVPATHIPTSDWKEPKPPFHRKKRKSSKNKIPDTLCEHINTDVVAIIPLNALASK